MWKFTNNYLQPHCTYMHATHFYPLVAVSGSTYSYTVGIDRVDASLLCNSSDDNIPIANLMWGIVGGGTWTNPINISEWSSTTPQQVNQLNCLVVGSVFISVTANIYGE